MGTVSQEAPTLTPSSNGLLGCGSPHGLSSPVAVPPPNRLHLNYHTNHARHESNSSASIGR
jgi:hypothetical protein